MRFQEFYDILVLIENTNRKGDNLDNLLIRSLALDDKLKLFLLSRMGLIIVRNVHLKSMSNY